MKAVVMKINKNKAVILKDDGSFISVANRNYTVGQKLKIKDKSSNSTISIKLIKAAVAAACIMLICFGAVYTYNVPQSYVSLDINPSIELEINMFNRVISANGVNDDGITVLENLEIGSKTMERALEMIMYQINKDGYINTGEEKPVVIGVHCSNHEKEKKVMENAKLQIEQSLENLAISTTVSIVTLDAQTIEQAHEIGTTGGKLNLAEEYAQTTGSQSDIKELVNIPVSQMTEAIEAAKSHGAGNPPEHANTDNADRRDTDTDDNDSIADKDDDESQDDDNDEDNPSNSSDDHSSNHKDDDERGNSSENKNQNSDDESPGKSDIDKDKDKDDNDPIEDDDEDPIDDDDEDIEEDSNEDQEDSDEEKDD